MAGAGVSAAGTSPAGTGTPAAATVRAGAALTASDGSRGTGRKFDPLTRAYVYDANGRAVGESSVAQMVKLAAMTDRGSAAVLELGSTIRSIQDVTQNFVQRVQDALSQALARLIARKLITIKSIDVDPTAGAAFGVTRASIIVRFVDLTTGQEEQVTL
jgi:hypothetical protein